MSELLTKYFTDLTAAFAAMEIQDASGRDLSTDDGSRAALDTILETMSAGGKVLVVGNGGSAAIASHTQNDFCKALGVRSLVFTEPPLLTAYSNDESYQTAYESMVKLWANEGDLLIAISSSGKSENILRCTRAAREAKCRIITLSGFRPDNPLRREGNVNFYVPSDSYGKVETIHGLLCQYFTDALKDR